MPGELKKFGAGVECGMSRSDCELHRLVNSELDFETLRKDFFEALERRAQATKVVILGEKTLPQTATSFTLGGYLKVYDGLSIDVLALVDDPGKYFFHVPSPHPSSSPPPLARPCLAANRPCGLRVRPSVYMPWVGCAIGQVMPARHLTGELEPGKVWPHLLELQKKLGTLSGALADGRLRVDLRDPSKVKAGIWVLGDWWRALGKDRQLGLSPRRCRSAPCVQRRVPRELPPFAAHARNKIQSLAGVKSPLKCFVLCFDRNGAKAKLFKPCAGDPPCSAVAFKFANERGGVGRGASGTGSTWSRGYWEY
jgi:hypothetical protein